MQFVRSYFFNLRRWSNQTKQIINVTVLISASFHIVFLLLIILGRVEGKGRFIIKRIWFAINRTTEKQWKSIKFISVKPWILRNVDRLAWIFKCTFTRSFKLQLVKKPHSITAKIDARKCYKRTMSRNLLKTSATKALFSKIINYNHCTKNEVFH